MFLLNMNDYFERRRKLSRDFTWEPISDKKINKSVVRLSKTTFENNVRAALTLNFDVM